MKKSELNKIIRETIKELMTKSNLSNVASATNDAGKTLQREAIPACKTVTRDCENDNECRDSNGARCGVCINPGAPHHDEPGVCTTGNFDKTTQRDNRMNRKRN